LREKALGNFQKTKDIPARQKLLNKKICTGSHGGKIEQVLSTIMILIFDVKQILAQAIAHQKNHAKPKGEKKKFMP